MTGPPRLLSSSLLDHYLCLLLYISVNWLYSAWSVVCHLQGNVLNSMAVNTLISAKPSEKSWFQQIRDLCVQYELPHPLHLLKNPMPKLSFKKLCKLKVTEYWHQDLSKKASNLPSLEYLKPSHLSLLSPHPIWTSPLALSKKIYKLLHNLLLPLKVKSM